MGFLGNIFFGGGTGIEAAQNAYLAEIIIGGLSDLEKVSVAREIIGMGMRASKSGVSSDRFIDLFNSKDRLCQLNIVALALGRMEFAPPGKARWTGVKNPFVITVSSESLEVAKIFLQKKYNITASLKNEKIDLRQWV